MNTVYERFHQSAQRWAETEFLHVEPVTAKAYGIEARSYTWSQALNEVQRLRAAYIEAGYGHGHRVGLMLENRPVYFFHWLALNSLGVSVVPMSIEMRSAELEYLIGHSEIALAVVLPQRTDLITQAAETAGIPTRVTDAAATAFPTPAHLAPYAHAPERATECALLYTSGTTGRPKGCRLTNDYFLHTGDWYTSLGGHCPVRPGMERIMTPLPLNHVNAMCFSAMAVITAGGCIIQIDRFHPKTWWESVRTAGATIVHYLGVMPAMLLSATPAESDTQHAVRWGFGAGVGAADHSVFEARFGFPLVEGWAMTETGAGAAIHASQGTRHIGTHYIGQPSSEVQVRVVAEDGSEAQAGETGELLVRASGSDPRRHFFNGYLKDEVTTEEAWAGGWFHTGDVVRRDEHGGLYFVDRKKNVIRRSGENISAVEVESVLNKHPAVKTTAVAATPDPVRGDEVLACVVTQEPVPQEQRAVIAASIVQWSLERLAYYKAPGYVAFVNALPVTSSQKIQRGELKTLAAQLPGQEHCIDTRHLKNRRP
jgi:acyl-CoA synthetase (AMP-forming)/AMP-acid ligase II